MPILLVISFWVNNCFAEMRSCPPAQPCTAQAATFCTVVTDCLIVRNNTVLEGNVTGAGLSCISGGGGVGPTGATGATGPLECVCCFNDQVFFSPFDMMSQAVNPLTTEPAAFSPYAPASNASLYGWELPVSGSDPNNTITMQLEGPSDYNTTASAILDINILITQAGQTNGTVLLSVFSDFLSDGQQAGAGTATITSGEINVSEPTGGPASIRQQRIVMNLGNPNIAPNNLGQISISRIPSVNEYNASVYIASASVIYNKVVCGIE